MGLSYIHTKIWSHYAINDRNWRDLSSLWFSRGTMYALTLSDLTRFRPIYINFQVTRIQSYTNWYAFFTPTPSSEISFYWSLDACIKLHQLNHEINLTWHNQYPEISGCLVAGLSNQNHLWRKSFIMDLFLGITACRATLPTDTTLTNIGIRTWVSLTAVAIRVWMRNSIPHETINIIIHPDHNMSVNGTTINWSIHQTNKWFGYGFY